MRVWIVLVGLVLSLPLPDPAQAIEVKCPDGTTWIGTSIIWCPCCIDCKDGTFVIEGEGSCDDPIEEFESEIQEPVRGDPVTPERYSATRAPKKSDEDKGSGLVGWSVLALLFISYFLPTVVAKRREHPQQDAILLLNLLLGWTILGWIAALIWSATSIERK